MATFSIAVATASDCHECARLLVNQLAEHDIDASTERLAHLLEEATTDKSRGFLMLARDNGRVVGIAYVATILSAEHCGPVAWLEELYVTPDCRYRGIGTALVTAAVERGQKAGAVGGEVERGAQRNRVIALS